MARRLGELLVADGCISKEVLARALELQGQQARGLRLGAILLRWGLIPEATLLQSLSIYHRCPAVDWTTLSAATKQAVDLLSPAQATRLGAVPYEADRKTIRVAFANPSNLAAIDEVQAITGKRVIPGVTTEVRLLQAQQRFYKNPLTRDIWMILQKLEKAGSASQPPATVPAATSARAQPRGLWIEGEPQSELPQPGEAQLAVAQNTEAPVESPIVEQAAADEPAVEDLIEPAPIPETQSILESVESSAQELDDFAERTIPVFTKAADFNGFDSFLDGLHLGELVLDRLDPFADDTPLADFIEQALSFYEAHPTFRSALAALDDGSVEDLGAVPEEKRPPSLSLDSTHPSSRRRRTEFDTEAEAAL